MNKEAIVIHIPHSSVIIPDEYKYQYLLSEDELNDELIKMTDRYIDEFFDITGLRIHQNQVSRLVMDPERFRSNDIEEMSKCGMGVAYTRTSDGRVLRKLSNSENDQILADLYDPYHTKLAQIAEEMLSTYGQCMIIDAHSFSSYPLPYENVLKHDDRKRPDICLGYEPFHIDYSFLQRSENFFNHMQLTVAHNFPYTGSLVPIKYYHKETRVQSLMIELNRALYMNEKTGQKLDTFQNVQSVIHGYFDMIANL